MPTQPVLFVGHGNPMNTLERNANSLAWREIGAGLPLRYIAALARPGENVALFNERIEYGAIGMLGCRIG